MSRELATVADDDRTISLDYAGQSVVIPIRGDNLVSLTDLWRAAGRPENKAPKDWLSTEQGKGFVGHLVGSLKVAKNHLIQIVRGRGVATSGTFAHRQIALAYAKYLSHRLHEAVNEAFFQWVEEQYDPGLKMERSIDLYQKLGKDGSWIEARFRGMIHRKALVSTMAEHNCNPKLDGFNAFAVATSKMQVALNGKTVQEIKEEKGISRKETVRDHMSEDELIELAMAENFAKRAIKSKGADGGKQCVERCVEAARVVAKAREAALR